MSIQQNFPATRPSLSLNFARSKTLDPRITFTRTSTATRVNGQGLIEVVPVNTPRFDHRYMNGEIESLGLLVEEQRINSIQVSQPAPADISKASNVEGWNDKSGQNLEFSSVISPDGTNNAVGVAYTSAFSNFQLPFIYNQQSLLSSNTTYTLSFWIDDTELVESNGYHLTTIIGTNSYFSLNGRYFRVNYNKDADTFSTPSYTTGSSVTAENADTIFPSANISGKVEKYPNNWKRISITFKVDSSYDGFYDSANTLADFRFSYGIYMGVSSYTNDNVGNSMSTWGWQLEQGSFPTSYIPTQGSTATRTPDNAKIEGTNFSDWYNPSEGTTIIQIRNYNISATSTSLLTYRGTIVPNNSMNYFRQSDAQPVGQIVYNGTLPMNIGLGAIWTTEDLQKHAFFYKKDDSGIARSNDVRIDTSVDIPEVNSLIIGSSTQTNNKFTISQLTYYPSRLPNEVLKTLTK